MKKNFDTWNRQSEKDLFNEHVDWSSTYYAVIMKDLTEKIVASYADESYDGAINQYYGFVGDDDDEAVDLDEILLWKEIEDPYKEQEAAKWSEEEESMIRCLEGFVKDAWAKAETEHDDATVKKMSNISFFLKTIKPWKK
jgi:hypothetical protein